MAQAGHRLLDHLQPLGGVQVVADLAQHDQVELSARPVARQVPLFDAGMAHTRQPLTGQGHGGGVDVLAQQVGAALGQQDAQFTVGAARLEHAFVALARQAGQGQVALASFVPASTKGPRVIVAGIQVGEILRVEAHGDSVDRKTSSKGCSKQACSCSGSTGG